MINMSFSVKIIRTLWDELSKSKESTSKFLFYGFYSKNENCNYLVSLEKTNISLDEPLEIPLKKDNLELLSWGYIKDPKVSFVSFENFKIQTHIQDIIPNAVMLLIGSFVGDIKVMRINNLKLEKVPYTIVDENDREYDRFLREQKNLAQFTDKDIFSKKKEYPITKRDMITEVLCELKTKIKFLEKHDRSISDYPDLENAMELAEEGLYGRANFYMRLVQKKIEDDVVHFRFKEKYEELLKTMKKDLSALPSEEERPDLSDVLTRIEQLIDRADAAYYKNQFKNAHSQLFRAHEHLLQLINEGEVNTELAVEEEDEFQPILTMEEFESGMGFINQAEYNELEMEKKKTYGDINEKIEDLEEKLRQNPHNKWILGELGDCYFEAGAIQNALESYKLQLKRTPDNSILLNNIGMIHKLQSNYKTAIDYFKKAIEKNPEYSEAYYNLGFLMFEEGDLEEAIKNYKKSVELDPDFNLAKDSLKVAIKKRDNFAKQSHYLKKK